MIEAGVILNGIPVFRVDYHAGGKGDPLLRSGMYSAIYLFGKEAFKEETEELRLKNRTIVMINVNIEGNDMILFSVYDKKTRNTSEVRIALRKIGSKLLALNKPIDPSMPSRNSFMRSIFDFYFSDLRLLPLDRAKKLFR